MMSISADSVLAHTFRHTLAARLLHNTGNLRLVQQAMGDRSIASTVRYTQVPSA
jgi:site-specific recombinase XerD